MQTADVLRIEVTGGSFLVNADDWEEERTCEFSHQGLFIKRRPSSVTWRLKQRNHTQYVVATVSGSLELILHRLIMSARRFQIVDHINHDGCDNRRENLRFCTQQENCHNSKSRKNTSSQFVGVSFNKALGLWEAYGKTDGAKECLGYFSTETEAALVRDEWVKANRPEFGHLNLATEAQQIALGLPVSEGAAR